MSRLFVEIHESSSKLWPRLRTLLLEHIGEQRLPIDLDVPKDQADVLLVPARFVSKDLLVERPTLSSIVIPHAAVEPNVKKAIEAAGREKSINVFNVHHNAAATAEYACALLFALARRVVPSDRSLRANDWSYRLKVRGGTEGAQLLYRGTALILGMGTVGSRIAQVLRALGMRVLATRRTAPARTDLPMPKRQRNNEKENAEEGIEIYPTEQMMDLLPVCTALVVSLPLTTATRGLLGQKEFALLPPNCCIVNVGRAEIMDEEALWYALNDEKQRLAFAADVWWQEPQQGGEVQGLEVSPSRFPFGTLDNVVLSPHHAGGIGLDGIEEERAVVVGELLAGLAKQGRAPTPVDLDVGY